MSSRILVNSNVRNFIFAGLTDPPRSTSPTAPSLPYLQKHRSTEIRNHTNKEIRKHSPPHSIPITQPANPRLAFHPCHPTPQTPQPRHLPPTPTPELGRSPPSRIREVVYPTPGRSGIQNPRGHPPPPPYRIREVDSPRFERSTIQPARGDLRPLVPRSHSSTSTHPQLKRRKPLTTPVTRQSLAESKIVAQ